MIKKNSHILLIMLFPVFLNAQEVLTGIYNNPLLRNAAKAQKTSKSNDTLWIPFVDDFSSSGIFPDDTLWSDKYVFVNSSYPYFPPTIGVATFDALNDTGALYTEAGAFGFTADSLTSKPIRLDSFISGSNTVALKISDSMYFSFFYQPQGIGNAPEDEDSLVLEFYAPNDSAWYHVWSSAGSTLAQFYTKYNVWFKQVMIPITDSATYFYKGFRFRFCNYASLANNSLPSWAGNVDQWNIDYVYLNKGRNRADSFYIDMAFVQPAPSVLKNYYSMPWSQFNINPSAEMKDSLNMTITNLTQNVTFDCGYRYKVEQVGGPFNASYEGGYWNLYPMILSGYQTYAPHAHPPVSFSFPSVAADSAEFIITHSIDEGVGDNLMQNDTVVFDQKFYNYYAYDDGTAEAGYGLTPANSTLAYQFTLNQPDTLRAVKMFFNQTYNNASQQYFSLTIWDDAPGYPDNIIYQQSGFRPLYADSLNTYHSYRICDTTIVLSGTFYVGWNQTTDDNLNLGFDKNSDVQSKIFYNTGGGWTNSIYHGALMIRPVFGNKLPEVTSVGEISSETDALIVYPNPATNNEINIILPSDMQNESTECNVSVYDIFGRIVFASPYSQHLQLPEISDGIYIVGVTSANTQRSCYTRISVVK